ncbi:MAG TPA: hypothetical protein VH641_21790 [Streptosporangiaceae bacterium]|jgi:hypothetical protein
MGLPTWQQRTLESIEGKLTESDPRLAALFAIFARLTRAETMPWFEQLTVRPLIDLFSRIAFWFRQLSRGPAARVRALVLLPAALTAMACALTLAFSFSGSQRTPPGAATTSTSQSVAKHRLCKLTLVRVPVLSC